MEPGPPSSLPSLLLLQSGRPFPDSGGGEQKVEDADDLHFLASLTFESLCKKHVCIYSVLDFSNFCILRAEHLFKHCTPTVTDLGPPSLSPVSALLINFSLKSSCARSSVSSWLGREEILKGAPGGPRDLRNVSSPPCALASFTYPGYPPALQRHQEPRAQHNKGLASHTRCLSLTSPI